jgi:ion channel-forming bestrophin family protein
VSWSTAYFLVLNYAVSFQGKLSFFYGSGLYSKNSSTFYQSGMSDAALPKNWFLTAIQFKGSVLPAILPRVLLFTGLACFAVWLEHREIHLRSLGTLTENVACNLVLGLLLVFRTNTAYERFWEGRKAWGILVATIRNLAQEIQLSNIEAIEKRELLNGLAAYAVAVKLHLRQAPIEEELKPFISDTLMQKLQRVDAVPLAILMQIRCAIKHYKEIDTNQAFILTGLLNRITEGFTNCERILKTPIPTAYAIYLKTLLLVYCGLLPFSLAESLQAWTGGIVAIVSFILLGVEQIGNEIENPFGLDDNDLPLDQICNSIIENIEETVNFSAEISTIKT